MPLQINKVMKANLPDKVVGEIDYLFFTDDGGIYTNKNDGTLLQLGGNSAVVLNYKAMDPNKYYTKTDTQGDYVEIPSEIIPKGEYRVEIESESILIDKTYSYATDPDSGDALWLTVSGSTATVMPPDYVGEPIWCWWIPMYVQSGDTITLKCPQGDRFTLGYMFKNSKPALGDKLNLIVQNNSLREYTWTSPVKGNIWLGLYCTVSKSPPPDLVTQQRTNKSFTTLPDWNSKIGSIEATLVTLDARVTALERGGGGTGGGLPFIDTITGDEPVGFAAILTKPEGVSLVARNATGWYRTAMSRFNPIAVYVWEHVPKSSQTGSSYTSAKGRYQVKRTMQIDQLSVPWGGVKDATIDGILYTPSEAGTDFTLFNIGIIVSADSSFEFTVTSHVAQKAAYHSGTYTSDIMQATGCWFGGSSFAGSFSVPVSIHYTLDV